MGNFISHIFPCMASATSDPPQTTITISSTSACCRGKIIQVTIDDEHKKEFEQIISDFVKKVDENKNNVSMV